MTSKTVQTETYAGDISSPQAWDLLKQDARAVLVDIRTDAEWDFVGVPDLAELNKKTKYVSWQIYPDMHRNPNFLTEIAAVGVAPDATVLLICRSGIRSRAAAIAMTAAGYGRCYNVAGGFEGERDAEDHRGAGEGWKFAGLPWRQT